jgi:hypothetical protein
MSNRPHIFVWSAALALCLATFGGHTVSARGSGQTAATGQTALGSVRINYSVTADGKSLPRGTYQLRLTPETAKPEVVGQTPQFERWVEFVQGGQVKAREVVTIVPQSEIDSIAEDAQPRPGGQKIEVLKGGDYVRIWIRRGDQHYLIHLPKAA